MAAWWASYDTWHSNVCICVADACMMHVYAHILVVATAAYFVQKVTAEEVVVEPRPITPTFMSDRIEQVDESTSKAIFDALTEAQLLDSQGLLKHEPR